MSQKEYIIYYSDKPDSKKMWEAAEQLVTKFRDLFIGKATFNAQETDILGNRVVAWEKGSEFQLNEEYRLSDDDFQKMKSKLSFLN